MSKRRKANTDPLERYLRSLRKPTAVDIAAASAIAEEYGGIDHIDIEAEEEELRQRFKARHEAGKRLAREILDSAGGSIAETELVKRLKEAGAFEGLERDCEIAQTLRLFRLIRAQAN